MAVMIPAATRSALITLAETARRSETKLVLSEIVLRSVNEITEKLGEDLTAVAELVEENNFQMEELKRKLKMVEEEKNELESDKERLENEVESASAITRSEEFKKLILALEEFKMYGGDRIFAVVDAYRVFSVNHDFYDIMSERDPR